MMKRIAILALVVLGFLPPASGQSIFPEKENPKIKVKSLIPIKAYAFKPSDVRITFGPFKKAMELNAKYLFDLEPDRFLHRFREYAGLKLKGELYGGWEALGVSGHTLGHYISALSLMYASTGEEKFKERVKYITEELALCQNRRKDGFVGGIPEQDRIFNEVASGNIRSIGFDLNGGWVPWYTVHKLLAGLVDAYYFTDNRKSFEVAVKIADWAVNKFDKLSEEQFQKMLDCEHGGMMEVMFNLYSLTGNKKYLDFGKRFYHHKILKPLADNQDKLSGIHANTQIPKVLGAAREFELDKSERGSDIANFYWETVVKHHSYAIGGASEHEIFGDADKISDKLGTTAAEVCHTYNMLKLTRHLYSWYGKEEYIDYYERALYNNILASQEPEGGMLCYFMSMKPGHFKTYTTPFNSFWCCTGSGIENHSRYTEAIYNHDDKGLFVNLFIPSQLNWKEKGLKIKMETLFPENGKVRLTVTGTKPVSTTFNLRYPKWATGKVTVLVNGNEQKVTANPGSYIAITRVWKANDVVELNLPMQLRLEPTPDNPIKNAILYGPIVLAGELGNEGIESPLPYAKESGEFTLLPVPIQVSNIVLNNEPVQDWISPVPEKPLTFKTVGVGRPSEISLIPFYKTHHQRYSVYWNVFNENQHKDWNAVQSAEQERLEDEERRTLDIMRTGEMQPERDHNLQGDKTRAGVGAEGRSWRMADAGGWFSFDMITSPETPTDLIVSYWGMDEGNREFHILVDNVKIATQKLDAKNGLKYFDVQYSIPAELTKGKSKVTVKFVPLPGKLAGGVYGGKTLMLK